MSNSYRSLASSMPMHGNAGDCGCGNGRQNYASPQGADYTNPGTLREDYTMGGMPAGTAGRPMRYGSGQACHFAAPPPRRVYCQPAQFSRGASGNSYASITHGYGQSRPHYEAYH